MTKGRKKTIMITSHNMKFIEDVCDRVIIINESKLVSKSSISILKNYYSQKKYLLKTCKQLKCVERGKIEKFGKVIFDEHKESCSMKIYLKKTDYLYNLFDLLKEKKVKIKDLEIEQSSLEDIFMHLINDGVAV